MFQKKIICEVNGHPVRTWFPQHEKEYWDELDRSDLDRSDLDRSDLDRSDLEITVVALIIDNVRFNATNFGRSSTIKQLSMRQQK